MWHKLEHIVERSTLAQRFQVASLIIMAVGMVAINAWMQGQIEAGVIHGTASTTALYVESFVAPRLKELANGQPLSAGQMRMLGRTLSDTPLGRQIVAFKVWDRDGTVIYDSDPANIGRKFPMVPRLQAAWGGATTSRISNLEDEENVAERQISQSLLETYSPVHLGNGNQIIGVAEFYQRVDQLRSDIAAAQRRSWVVVSMAMLGMYLLLSGFVRRASDTISGQQQALAAQVVRLRELLSQNTELHERVRAAALQAGTLNERLLRRISAELHDGPAQELSLALLEAEPDDVDGAGGAARENMARIRDALRRALEEIRAIAAGLGVPDLERLSLLETLHRSVAAHEARTHTEVELEVASLPAEASLPIKIAVYRLVQEALNNAYRHAGGAGQRVCVRGEAGQLELEISDQGPGFDPGPLAGEEGHLGLLGMRERVQSLGGAFHIESGLARGTRVVARLPLQAEEYAYA